MNQIIKGLPFAEYRALPGMSISDLKVLRDSPSKYLHNLTAEREETAAMALGTAVHTAILEPRKLLTDYVLWEGGVRRGKDWDAFQVANAGKRILKADEFDQVQAMRDRVRGYAPAMKYLERGYAEVSMQWIDEETGRLCRGRLDWLTPDHVIADLKTAQSVQPFRFGAQAAKLGYHLQLAYYFDGYKAVTGVEPRMVILGVESSAPYDPAVFSIPEDVLLQGREEYRALLHRLTDLEASNHWPPALEDEEPLTLPSWVYGSEDDDLSGLGLIA